MNRSQFSSTPYTKFEIHQVNSTGKIRDSPTSSILKTPTAIFVTTRSSSAKTRKLKFANGPVDLQTLKNGTHESNVSLDSGVDLVEEKKLNNNGVISFEESNIIEVAISPVKTMQVSPESWKAFLEYKKYSDYPNETEKTDYTYSRLSKFRHKEIIPGFLIRPNLSRSSISSRRSSSFSLPSSQSSFNELYHLGSYDFKVHNQSNPEIIHDLKASSQPNKFVRSKYYLRSSNSNWTDTSEADVNARNYVEKEYYVHSPTEKITKSYSYSTSEAPEQTTHYYGKIRSVDFPEQTTHDYGKIRSVDFPEQTTHYYGKVRNMDFDDADVDEVDENPVHSEKHYYSSSGLNTGRFGARDVQPQTISQNFKNFFTTVFLYVTSVGTLTKDLFSKYILRRQDDWNRSPSALYNWKSDSYGKSMGESSWIPWGQKSAYSTGNYYSGAYYGQPRSWYQRIYHYFSDQYSQFTNLLWGNTAGYTSYRYQDPSRKRKFWWLLIPLLLLAGLWLYRAEQENGFLSHQYKELDCMTNGFLTSMENTIKPIWKSSTIAYKRAAASASCYVNDSWERLKLPFTHISEWLCSKFSSLSEGSLGFVFAIWNVVWQGLWNILTLTRDTFSNFCFFLLDFFTDFISAVGNMLYYFSKNFMDVFFNIFNSLGLIFGNAWKLLANTLRDLWSYLYLLLLAPRSEFKHEHRKPEFSQEACLREQKDFDKLSSEIEGFKSMSLDLSSIKKKIDDLEAEFKREKEFARTQNNFFEKQLGDNHKTFQKYQATVNHALLSSKRPSQLSSSSVQYLLDNQSDALKQWITQNFLLKTDSVDLDESKIAPLIAKYGNKTGDDLLALKRELQMFVRNYKSDLESLRNNFNSLEANNLGGSDVSLAFIKKLITEAIKLYDADKTGRVDYALETAGGQVQSIRCTETYMESPKSYVFFGWPVYTEATSPREAIRPGMAAGQCWAFVGSQGFLVLKLSHTIRVTGFTMEHISKLLVPRGHIESAPKNFSMWGLKSEHDKEPYLFGEYAYLDNGETLQYFPVTYPTNERYNMVELKIISNHGNPNFTCLYRIRVHGDMKPVHL